MKSIPKTPHFNTNDCSTEGLQEKQATLFGACYKLGENPWPGPWIHCEGLSTSAKAISEVTAVLGAAAYPDSLQKQQP